MGNYVDLDYDALWAEIDVIKEDTIELNEMHDEIINNAAATIA